MKASQMLNLRVLFVAVAFISFWVPIFAQRPCMLQRTTVAYNQLVCERHCKNSQFVTVCQRNRNPRPQSTLLVCPMACCRRRGVCVYP